MSFSTPASSSQCRKPRPNFPSCSNPPMVVVKRASLLILKLPSLRRTPQKQCYLQRKWTSWHRAFQAVRATWDSQGRYWAEPEVTDNRFLHVELTSCGAYDTGPSSSYLALQNAVSPFHYDSSHTRRVLLRIWAPLAARSPEGEVM